MDIQQLTDKIIELELTLYKNHIRYDAGGEALFHVLGEVVAEMGISPERFADHFGRIRNLYHTQYLDRLSRDSEQIAVMLDDLPIESIYTGEPIPPLFPLHPPQ